MIGGVANSTRTGRAITRVWVPHTALTVKCQELAPSAGDAGRRTSAVPLTHRLLLVLGLMESGASTPG